MNKQLAPLRRPPRVCVLTGWIASVSHDVLLSLTPAALLFRRRASKRLPINVEHNIERNELWVILILGETVIQLVSVKPAELTQLTFEYYAVVAVCFSMAYLLLQIYIKGQVGP